ncbi:MAG: PhoH family protein [Nanoarchaeota archaeon]
MELDHWFLKGFKGKVEYKVVDTNVYLNAPTALLGFQPPDEDKFNVLIVPPAVLMEMDHKKEKMDSTLGKNARAFANLLDRLSQTNDGRLHTGLVVAERYAIMAPVDVDPIPNGPSLVNKSDEEIIRYALAYLRSGANVELVTQDTNMRNIARAFDVTANPYDKIETVGSVDDIWPGYRTAEGIDEVVMNSLAMGNDIEAGEIPLENPMPNEYFLLRGVETEKRKGHPLSRIVKYKVVRDGHGRKEGEVFRPILQEREQLLHGVAHQRRRITPRNLQQSMFMDALCDDDIKVVFGIGPAGTGKTLLAIEAAYLQLGAIQGEDHGYSRLLMTRPPIQGMPGRELGFMPGSLSEKLNPWMQPFFDNLELVLESYGRPLTKLRQYFLGDNDKDSPHGKQQDTWSQQQDAMMGFFSIQHAQGRSLGRTILVVDEAQNTYRQEIKTLITRPGDDSKIFIVGDPDPDQIYAPGLTTGSCGLVYASQNMREDELSATVYLRQVERSRLAEAAVRRL